jgi:hypothetical protein
MSTLHHGPRPIRASCAIGSRYAATLHNLRHTSAYVGVLPFHKSRLPPFQLTDPDRPSQYSIVAYQAAPEARGERIIGSFRLYTAFARALAPLAIARALSLDATATCGEGKRTSNIGPMEEAGCRSSPRRYARSVDTPPTTFVLDAESAPRSAIERDFDWDLPDLEAMLEKLSVAGRDP